MYFLLFLAVLVSFEDSLSQLYRCKKRNTYVFRYTDKLYPLLHMISNTTLESIVDSFILIVSFGSVCVSRFP